MKICTSEQEYLDIIAPAAQKACKRYGYLPSVLIAQACVENGYGIRSYWDNPQIEALMAYNNMVGIKSSLLNSSWTDIGLSVWPGESLTKKTPEVYGGKQVTITDNFRKYDSIEQSFVDYLLFMTYASNSGAGGAPKYGKAILGEKDPETLIRAVNSRGYTTGTTYPTSVMKIIRKHGLTKYDDLSKVAPTSIIPPALRSGTSSSNLRKITNRSVIDITARNRSQVPRARTQKIEFIVCHYLGVPNADNPDLYDGGKGGHYNIKRDGSIYKAADPKTAVVWHCGGELQGSGGHSFYKICTNFNSIGVECGVCYTENVKEASGDSGKWYFTTETQESLVWLVSKLMDEYGISIDHVIRHYDVTGKICPNPYVLNNKLRTSWTWDEFRARLAEYRKSGGYTAGSGTEPVQETKYYRVRKAWSDAASQLGAYTVLDNAKANCPAGYAIYDYKGKEIYRPEEKAVETAADRFLAAVKNVCDKARKSGWKYGDSRTTPPCADKTISCDRMVSRALYDLGFTDQRAGGEVCTSLPTWLVSHGWKAVYGIESIKPGAVVAVRKRYHSYIDDVFVVASYDPKTGICAKYDCGSQSRINAVQPYKNVQLLEWPDRVYVDAWNPPSVLSPAQDPGDTEDTGMVYNGVDYAPVFDAAYYSKKYSDLRKAFGSDQRKLFEHFCKYGMREGRQACAAFNVRAYRSRYADLKKAYGNDLPGYYRHFCLYGKREGRKAT